MRFKKIITILVFIFLLLSLAVHEIVGVTDTSVDASIKIGVCGDGIVDRGEDCEGSNLNNTTCVSLGYAGGTLLCDISCSFNTSNCITPSPTPTPTATPTPTSTPTPTTTPIPSSTPTPGLTATITNTGIPNSPTPQSTSTPIPTAVPTPLLPPALQVFDINNTGHITISELPLILKTWVDNWKNSLSQSQAALNNQAGNTSTLICDTNRDGICDIKDLSVLLYYVNR